MANQRLVMEVIKDDDRKTFWLTPARASQWAKTLEFEITTEQLMKATQEKLG